MPSININSRGTTIKLTRAEVRAMQTAINVCDTLQKHSPNQDLIAIATDTSSSLDAILDLLNEKPATDSNPFGKPAEETK